jgi:lipid II:glycine glycyltransferase (peptidoglycan interpeptide bridge formation enzyme)
MTKMLPAEKRISALYQTDILFQTAFWSRIKSCLGWTPLAFEKTKIRRNIGFVKSKDVHVFRTGRTELRFFYELYKKTAILNGFSPTTCRQFQTLFSKHARHPEFDIVLLFTASGTTLLPGEAKIISGRRATYLFKALATEKRNMTGCYALLSAAIQMPKQKGCLVYDMGVVAPMNESGHSCYGMYRFTAALGRKYFHREESHDLCSHESLLIVSKSCNPKPSGKH